MPQMYCSLRGLLYSSYSRVFGRSHVRRQMPTRPPTTREILIAKGGTMWARINRKCCLRLQLPRPCRDLLHAANLRHRTHGFTSLPNEGVLRIFSPWKILTASAGFEPTNLGTSRQHATPRPPMPLGQTPSNPNTAFINSDIISKELKNYAPPSVFSAYTEVNAKYTAFFSAVCLCSSFI